MTQRGTLALCCVHIPPINYSSGYLNNTVYFAIMLQDSWYIAEGN